MTPPTDREEFLRSARAFVAERTGVCDVDPDQNLVAAGIFDSLLLVDFFFFVEDTTGAEIPSGAEAVQLMSSLNGAYRLAVGTTGPGA